MKEARSSEVIDVEEERDSINRRRGKSQPIVSVMQKRTS